MVNSASGASRTPPPQRQLDRLQQYFNTNAAEWEDLYQRPRKVNDLVLANRRRVGAQSIKDAVAPGSRVLDAGCGAGLVSLDLLSDGYFVHGVDIAQEMLDLCARRFSAAGISSDRYASTCTNISADALASGSFAGIIALGFLEYQEDEAAALGQFYRLLEPGGTLVISGATGLKLANYLGLAGTVKQRLTQWGVLQEPEAAEPLWKHRYSFHRFRLLLAQAGFEVVKQMGHGYVEFEGVAPHLSYESQVLLHRAFTRLSKYLPIGRWGNDLINVARKPHAF